jgi:hypothetical protein
MSEWEFHHVNLFLRLPLVFEQIEKYIATEHISGKQDKRTTIAPYYPIKYYFDDYLNDKDPAMDFVSLYQHKPRKRTGRVKFPTSKYLYNDINIVDFRLDLGGLQMNLRVRSTL